MTDKEKYKKAFSVLHASEKISLEAGIMEERRHAYRMKKALAACAAAAVMFGSMTAAYAADLGGIQQKITTWIHGEQTELDVTDNGGGSYSYSYTDTDGNVREGGGGGVAIDFFGNETPLPAEDVLKDVGNSVETDGDGRVWIYYHDKKAEITGLFGDDGICRAALEDGENTAYFKIDSKDVSELGSYGYEMTQVPPADAELYTLAE